MKKKNISPELIDELSIIEQELKLLFKEPKKPHKVEIVIGIFMIGVAIANLFSPSDNSYFISLFILALASQNLAGYFYRKKYYDFYKTAASIINFHKQTRVGTT